MRVATCWRKCAVWLLYDLSGPTSLPVGLPSGPPEMWGDICVSRVDIMLTAHTHTHWVYIARYVFCWWGDVSRRKSKPQLPEQWNLWGMFSWELCQLFTSWLLSTETHTHILAGYFFLFKLHNDNNFNSWKKNLKLKHSSATNVQHSSHLSCAVIIF